MSTLKQNATLQFACERNVVLTSTVPTHYKFHYIRFDNGLVLHAGPRGNRPFCPTPIHKFNHWPLQFKAASTKIQLFGPRMSGKTCVADNEMQWPNL